MYLSFSFSTLLLGLNILGFIQASVKVCLIPVFVFFGFVLCSAISVLIFLYKCSKQHINNIEAIKRFLEEEKNKEKK